MTIKIKNLSPAETLMIQSAVGVEGRKLMKMTFIELVFKKVLKVYSEWRYPHPNSPRESCYTFVVRGENFYNFTSSIFHQPFLEIFTKDYVEFQVRGLFKYVIRKCEGFKKYKRNYVYPVVRKKKWLRSSYGLKYLRLYFYTTEGRVVKSRVDDQLKQANEQLIHYLKTDIVKAREIIEGLGVNIILLNNFDVELMKQIQSRMPVSTKSRSTYEDHGFDYVIVDAGELFTYAFIDGLDRLSALLETVNFTFDSVDFSMDDIAFDVSDFSVDLID